MRKVLVIAFDKRVGPKRAVVVVVVVVVFFSS